MQEVAHVGALQQLVMRTVSLTDWTPLNECRYAALQTATKREKKKPTWGYGAAASAAVSMKSLTEARRRMLAVMAWSNLIWCLLCVLWGTCWNSLSTYESHTSVERGGITWHSVWEKKRKRKKRNKQCIALICTPPWGDVLSPVSSSAGSRWKFLLDGKRNI